MKIRPLHIVLLLICVISISCSSLGTFLGPRDGVYLIPKGYTGEVIILFDQPDGLTPEVENGLLVYKIPDDGPLKVKNKGYTGTVDLRYYYVDSDGKREQIESLRITGDRDISGNPKDKFDGQINSERYQNGIFVMGSGGVATTNSGGKSFSYTSFVVGNPKDSARLYDEMQQRISDIQRDFLRENRP